MEQQRPVRILIGPDSYNYDKAEIPVPEVPFGEPFEIQVEWGEETDPRLAPLLELKKKMEDS